MTVANNGGLVMFLEIVASLMFVLGFMSFGFLLGMEFGQALERKASAVDVKDEETEA
ncbi:MAG: hypothetical protein KDA54_20085 [Phycisphaerales bacterium]|nr:hypothetical protein [Phycisphaerales bacterium]